MENDSILEFKRRREIYEFISRNSGLHIREISRTMNIPLSTLKYHLNYLEKKGLILSREDGKYSRYFLPLEIGEEEKKIINCLRKRTALHIILWLFVVAQCSQKDFSNFLEKHPATINFHLRNMMAAGIIEQVSINEGVIHKKKLPILIQRTKVSSEKIYVLKDPLYIYSLILKYREHLDDQKIVSGVIDYIEFCLSEGVPEQIQDLEGIKNSIVNVFCELFFPSTFCL